VPQAGRLKQPPDGTPARSARTLPPKKVVIHSSLSTRAALCPELRRQT